MKRLLLLNLFLVAVALPLRSAQVATSLSAAKAYPNPWRIDKHPNVLIKLDGMPASSIVKIFTVSGHEVKVLSADSTGLALWDRTNDSGQHVASGVYIYLIIDPQGNSASGKIAIIK